MRWAAAEPDVGSVLAEHPDPLASLARAEVPAIVLRGAYPAEHCAALIDRFVARGLMDPNLLDADSVQPRRVDIGTSLSNRAADKEGFLAHAQQTRELFATLFAGHPDPVQLVYDRLAGLAPGKRVTTAYEPGGRAYGPAIFRIHYAGHRYQPHVDHVGKHERRLDYAVSRFAHQFAGVLCLQNSRSGGRVAQSILHRCLWTPELEPCLQADAFADYAAANAVEHYQVDLQPGDLYFFNTRLVHEVPALEGSSRVVLAAGRVRLAVFIGYSEVIRWTTKYPLVMTPQPEGGYTVTSPLLPELVTEGDSLGDALENAKDALAAVVELYQDLGKSLPKSMWIPGGDSPVWLETAIAAP